MAIDNSLALQNYNSFFDSMRNNVVFTSLNASTVRITLPFLDTDGNNFRIFLIERDNELYLTDNGYIENRVNTDSRRYSAVLAAWDSTMYPNMSIESGKYVFKTSYALLPANLLRLLFLMYIVDRVVN